MTGNSSVQANAIAELREVWSTYSEPADVDSKWNLFLAINGVVAAFPEEPQRRSESARLQIRADLGRVEHDTIVDAWREEDCIHWRTGLGWDSCDHPLGLLLRRINRAQLDHLDQVRRIKEIREARGL